MKLTDQHLSEGDLDVLIQEFSYPVTKYVSEILLALLELKQRRDEDRQREAGKLCKCHPHDLVYYGCRCGANFNSEAENVA